MQCLMRHCNATYMSVPGVTLFCNLLRICVNLAFGCVLIRHCHVCASGTVMCVHQALPIFKLLYLLNTHNPHTQQCWISTHYSA